MSPERTLLESAPNWSSLDKEIRAELISFSEDGLLDKDSYGSIVEAVLCNDLKKAVSLSADLLSSDSQLLYLTSVVEHGLPLSAHGSMISVQSYMRSRRDKRSTL